MDRDRTSGLALDKLFLVIAGTAFTMLAIFAVFLLYFTETDTIASIVRFDVNPSVQLEINSKREVLNAIALNQDGRNVLQDTQLKELSLEEATRQITLNLIAQGYMGLSTSTVLVSVEDPNEKRGKELASLTEGYVCSVLLGESMAGAVTSISFPLGSHSQEALEHSISPGKIALIQEIYTEFPLEYMVALPLCELLDFVESKVAVQTPIGLAGAEKIAKMAALLTNNDNFFMDIDVQLTDTVPYYGVTLHTTTAQFEIKVHALDSTVISNQRNQTIQDSLGLSTHQGRDIALQEMLRTELQVTDLDFQLDWSEGRLAYQVSATGAKDRHTVVVSAVNGTVYSHTQEPVEEEPLVDTSDLGRDVIIQLALSHSGVDQDMVYEFQDEKMELDGKVIYYLQFLVGDTQYRYTLLSDGTIFAYYSVYVEVEEEPEPTYISQGEASDIAINHSGVPFDQAKEIVTEQMDYQEEMAFHVVFQHLDNQYSYIVSTESGSILSYEKRNLALGQIGEVEARKIALNHARVSADLISSLGVELKEDTNQYAVTFSFGSTLYHYFIDATTGEVKSVTREAITPEYTPSTDSSLELDSFNEMFDHFGSDFWD